jgi:glycine oxidase
MRAVAALLSPALAAAPLLDRWAGLRPGSADGLPLIGAPVSGPRGLIVATGHFRNGILLTPITAEIVRDLVVGRAARIDPTPFRPDRPFPASVGGGRPQGR